MTLSWAPWSWAKLSWAEQSWAEQSWAKRCNPPPRRETRSTDSRSEHGTDGRSVPPTWERWKERRRDSRSERWTPMVPPWEGTFRNSRPGFPRPGCRTGRWDDIRIDCKRRESRHSGSGRWCSRGRRGIRPRREWAGWRRILVGSLVGGRGGSSSCWCRC